MILYEITSNEAHPVYQELEISNGERHYSFLQSIVDASVKMGRPFLSQTILKALNFHAIACLHTNAGEYRPCEVTVGTHRPPAFFKVAALMDDFINDVNRNWSGQDAVVLATYVLWRLNYIHPFINGNGRTARAACYFVICVSSGGLVRGTTLLPALLKREKARLCEALAHADASVASGTLDIAPLHALVAELLNEQLESENLAQVVAAS